MLVLTRSDLKRLVPMSKAIDLVETAFVELREGRADVPLRMQLDVKPGQDTMLMMPAYMSGIPVLGFKVISIFQRNGERGLPIGQAMVCVIDPETGVPLAIMNGAWLTQLRTGAVSGASSRLMSRKDAKRLTVIGAGTQGVTQAAAVASVRELEGITVVYRSRSSFDTYLEAIRADWPELTDLVKGTDDAEAACRDADIICLATTSKQPVFDNAWIRDGTHVSGVGSFTPEMQEVPADFVQRARVVVDMAEHALEEAGDLIVPLKDGVITRDHIVGELGDLVNGDVKGRTSDMDVTFFKSVGNAVQDMVVAAFAVEQAKARGCGQDIDLG